MLILLSLEYFVFLDTLNWSFLSSFFKTNLFFCLLSGSKQTPIFKIHLAMISVSMMVSLSASLVPGAQSWWNTMKIHNRWEWITHWRGRGRCCEINVPQAKKHKKLSYIRFYMSHWPPSTFEGLCFMGGMSFLWATVDTHPVLIY